jgi:hypothetical protein
MLLFVVRRRNARGFGRPAESSASLTGLTAARAVYRDVIVRLLEWVMSRRPAIDRSGGMQLAGA